MLASRRDAFEVLSIFLRVKMVRVEEAWSPCLLLKSAGCRRRD